MILDIVIVALILLGAFTGYKKGLIGIFVSLVSIILSIVLALVLQGPISEALYNNTGMGKIIEETVYNNIVSANKKEDASESNFYDNITKMITSNAENTSTNEQIAKTITMFILKGISFVIIFIVVAIVCFILKTILNLVFNLPLLDIVNKWGGLAAGAVKTLLKLSIVLALISFIAPTLIIEPVVNLINNSTVTKVLYENNLLTKIIYSTLKI